MSGTHRILLFGSLLAAGACTASLFRKPIATDLAAPAAPHLVHRAEGARIAWGSPHIESTPPNAESAGGESSPLSRAFAPRVTIGGATAASPPDLPAESPLGFFPLRAPPPEGDENNGNPRGRHRVVDGDSLAALAEHYLGDPNRGGEIAAANAELIGLGGALPIGADLVIPDAGTTGETPIPRAAPLPLGAPLDFIRPANGR